MKFTVVDDCLKVIPNRFEMVLAAASRTRALMERAPARVSINGDVPVVVALREIEAGAIDVTAYLEMR